MTKKPISIMEAIDQTADKDILDHLWQMTQYRLEEENQRRDGVRERTSKMVIFSFSVLATIGTILAFTKDDISHVLEFNIFWKKGFLYLGSLGLFILLIMIGTIFIKAKNIIGSQSYRTFDEKDLLQVELGGKDGDHGYFRFLIKAAWNVISKNSAINDQLVLHFDYAFKSFIISSFLTIFLIVVMILVHLPD